MILYVMRERGMGVVEARVGEGGYDTSQLLQREARYLLT